MTPIVVLPASSAITTPVVVLSRSHPVHPFATMTKMQPIRADPGRWILVDLNVGSDAVGFSFPSGLVERPVIGIGHGIELEQDEKH